MVLTVREVKNCQLTMAAQDVKTQICSAVNRACIKTLQRSFKALILTGSLARDEATVHSGKEGVRILGDADFLIVVKGRRDLLRDTLVEGIARCAETALTQERIFCSIGLSIVIPRYLIGLTPHIFGVELQCRGQVVSGDPRVLSLIPHLDPSDIPRYDAWCLLCNRITEQLETASQLSVGDDVLPPAVAYKTAKLYLDMATSLLVFLRAFRPSYSERLCALLELASVGDPDLPFALGEFAEHLRICMAVKLARLPPSTIQPVMWFKAVEYSMALVRWERKHLGTARTHSIATTGGEPLSKVMRGWASLLHRQSWRNAAINLTRWTRLACSGSPRNHIYSASTSLFAELPRLLLANEPAAANRMANILRKHLPLLDSSENNQLSWQDVIREILRNYREFLVSTRA